TADFAQHGFDAATIVVNGHAADFHLDHGISAVEVAAHLRPQFAEILTGVIIAAGGVDKNARVGFKAMALGKQAEERLASNFGYGVPYSHVDGTNSDRTFTMAAGLFIAHHCGPDAIGIEIIAASLTSD